MGGLFAIHKANNSLSLDKTSARKQSKLHIRQIFEGLLGSKGYDNKDVL